jgi:hypothetical protein
MFKITTNFTNRHEQIHRMILMSNFLLKPKIAGYSLLMYRKKSGPPSKTARFQKTALFGIYARDPLVLKRRG